MDTKIIRDYLRKIKLGKIATFPPLLDHIRQRAWGKCKHRYTLREQHRLEMWGGVAEALMLGELRPLCREEELFVAFCNGEGPAPGTFARLWERCYLEQLRGQCFDASKHLHPRHYAALFEQIAAREAGEPVKLSELKVPVRDIIYFTVAPGSFGSGRR